MELWKNADVVKLIVSVETPNRGNAVVDRSANVKTANVLQSVDVKNKLVQLTDRKEEILHQLKGKGLSQVDAEELFQGALLKAISSFEQLETPEKFESWFRVILKNQMFDFFRKERRLGLAKKEMETLSLEVLTETESSFCQCVFQLMDLIGEDLREVLYERVLKGKDLKSTARTLGISENLVKVRAHRARLAMKKRLKECCGMTRMAEASDCDCS